MANEVNKVIYSMIGVSKIYDKKPVLKDIYLSYFYGAKIGVIGFKRFGQKFSSQNTGRSRSGFSRPDHSFRRLYRRLPGTGTASG